jgi:hypothetical protein
VVIHTPQGRNLDSSIIDPLGRVSYMGWVFVEMLSG